MLEEVDFEALEAAGFPPAPDPVAADPLPELELPAPELALDDSVEPEELFPDSPEPPRELAAPAFAFSRESVR